MVADDSDDPDYVPPACWKCDTDTYARCCTCATCVKCAGHPTPETVVDMEDHSIFTSKGCAHVCCCVQAPGCCDEAACKHDLVVCAGFPYVHYRLCHETVHTFCTSTCEGCGEEGLCGRCVSECEYCKQVVCYKCRAVDEQKTEFGFRHIVYGKSCDGVQCVSCKSWCARDTMLDYGTFWGETCEVCGINTCWKVGCAGPCAAVDCSRENVCASCMVEEDGVGMVCRRGCLATIA